MIHTHKIVEKSLPAGKYLFKVKNKDSRIESITFLLLTLNMYLPKAFRYGNCDFMEHVNLYAPYKNFDLHNFFTTLLNASKM